MGLDCTRLDLPDVARVTTTTREAKLVSIVAPFYNEGEVVKSFYQAMSDVLDGLSETRFEVICVDDGSRDDTLQRLIALTNRDARFSVIELSRNFGKEAALTAGLDAAKGDAVIPIDADLQDPPELIPTLIAAWQRGADVVLAERVDRDFGWVLETGHGDIVLSPAQLAVESTDTRECGRLSPLGQIGSRRSQTTP